MFNSYRPCPFPPCYAYILYNMYTANQMYPQPVRVNMPKYNRSFSKQNINLIDYGSKPFVVNIEEATMQNETFRTALWTGDNLQVTLMDIKPGEDIGLEVHPNIDQFIRIEQGQGIVKMGDNKNNLDFQAKIYDDYAIMIPAGKWHNVINTGNNSLKLYTIYAPPEHPYGTVHITKADAEAAENKTN